VVLIVTAVAITIYKIGIFTVLMMVFKGLNFGTVVIASVLARIVSSIVNFTLNRNLVFQQGRPSSAVKYFILVVVQIMLSSYLVTFFGQLWQAIPISVVKIIVDRVLFFVSYFVQKRFIFRNNEN
uniref:GtrA family protein n=1 Tax=uncultured Streptococcus sp. TaxID=83427 RepID=UPI0025D0257D